MGLVIMWLPSRIYSWLYIWLVRLPMRLVWLATCVVALFDARLIYYSVFFLIFNNKNH